MKREFDPENGLPIRDVDIASISRAKDIPTFGKPKGPHLFDRLEVCYDYVESQKKSELWLYNRKMITGPSTEVLATDDNGNQLYGINFASADYLGLAQNDFAKEAAISAAK